MFKILVLCVFKVEVTTGSGICNGKIIVKIVNLSDCEQAVNVQLKNAPSLSSSAKVTVLEGEKNAENSFAEPENIVPQEKTFDGVSSDFTYPAAPYSLSILEIDAK